jgi:hypothetical protein
MSGPLGAGAKFVRWTGHRRRLSLRSAPPAIGWPSARRRCSSLDSGVRHPVASVAPRALSSRCSRPARPAGWLCSAVHRGRHTRTTASTSPLLATQCSGVSWCERPMNRASDQLPRRSGSGWYATPLDSGRASRSRREAACGSTRVSDPDSRQIRLIVAEALEGLSVSRPDRLGDLSCQRIVGGNDGLRRLGRHESSRCGTTWMSI